MTLNTNEGASSVPCDAKGYDIDRANRITWERYVRPIQMRIKYEFHQPYQLPIVLTLS